MTAVAVTQEASAAAAAAAPRSSAASMAVGVALLTTALLLSARLGIFQETLYSTYGKHSQQALFFTVRQRCPVPQGTAGSVRQVAIGDGTRLQAQLLSAGWL